MMTRKHYQAMAEAMGKATAAGALASRRPEAAARILRETTEEIEAFFLEDNPAFDHKRFRAAVEAAAKSRALELAEVEFEGVTN